ncbi:hypothetical protein FCL40_17090 [Ferrimonas sediminicola]|uniref:Tyr recombinase domain-containing protein n=1 Tax=Ferrimonas sediminicola TaxID=2569538 RepID=A0A4U1B817_9GAMM|nr:tyrosine-type recombinase/integrase [Ferrimonas sediminicola]TKB46772.1 hypothetical protein FCL40_17090 [Ferrimonas sediminicola]
MGRKSESWKRPDWLPTGISKNGNLYYWRPGGGLPSVKLCSVKSSRTAVERAFAHAKAQASGQRTFDDLFAKHADIFKGSKATLADMANYYRCYIEPQWQFRDPDSITHIDLNNWFDELQKERSHSVAKNVRCYLGMVYKMGMSRGWCKTNPVKLTETIKLSKEEKIAKAEAKRKRPQLSWEEFDKVYDLATPQIKIIMLLGALCGLRRTDCAEVKLEDLEDDGIYVLQSKNLVQQVKGWNARLREVLELHKQQPLRGKPETVEKNRAKITTLLYGQYGQPYSAAGISNLWNKFREKLRDEYDIDLWWAPHEHKRFFSTELYQETGDLNEVAKATGNNDVATLKRSYIQGIPVVTTIDGSAGQSVEAGISWQGFSYNTEISYAVA